MGVACIMMCGTRDELVAAVAESSMTPARARGGNCGPENDGSLRAEHVYLYA